jgi:hypothetical protein
MAKARKTSSASIGIAEARELAERISKHRGISEEEANRLILGLLSRQNEQGLSPGWWKELLEAQLQTHLGPHKRIRCGDEINLCHLIPKPGGLCQDCKCSRGEYHVFGCDAEECSNCGQQAFCCDCEDGSTGVSQSSKEDDGNAV